MKRNDMVFARNLHGTLDPMDDIVQAFAGEG
jgi:hypothetical protein